MAQVHLQNRYVQAMGTSTFKDLLKVVRPKPQHSFYFALLNNDEEDDIPLLPIDKSH